MLRALRRPFFWLCQRTFIVSILMESIASSSTPRSLTELFFALTSLTLQGFGGVVAIVQRELVERRRWLTQEEFVEDWAVAQIMPGPNVVNLCLSVGARYFGWRGAIVGVLGLVTVPILLVLILALGYMHWGSHPAVVGALRGMGAVAAGLIMGTGLKLFSSLKSSPLGMTVCVLLGSITFMAAALLRFPLIYILLGPGLVACFLAYRRLGA